MGNKNIRVKGQLNQYIKWPIYFSALWVFTAIICFMLNVQAGICVALLGAIYIGITAFIYARFKPIILKRLVDFGAEYSQIQRQMLHELEIPYVLMDESGRIMWTNTEFDMLMEGKSVRNKSVTSVFEGFKEERLTIQDSIKNEFQLSFKDCEYRVVIKPFELKEAIDESHVVDIAERDAKLLTMYMFDNTLINRLLKENKDEKVVEGHICIDNYDEVLQGVEAARRTLLVALIDRRINRYFTQYDGIVRKLENDKYFVIFKAKYINKMQTDKFSVLDEVKAVNIGNTMPVTISIGLGMGGNGMIDNYEFAGSAIDMALGRGGDQAVLKDGNRVYYYGGKTKSVEKNTKVKSRVKATAFRDLIETKEKIYIMGHHIGDNDSFGASIGFYRIAKTIGKEARIVLGEVSSSVTPLVNSFKESDDYEESMFITGASASEEIGKNDALIIVDCSRAGYTEHPDLVRKAQCLIVIDHHRQTADVIDNAQLSYIELSASSASEIVVEIMQYIKEAVHLTKMEAEALYSGIMIDTNNFTNRTGVRTFEAAAYLRRKGADITKVRRMFRDDIEDYKARAEAISNTEIYLEEYAISECRAVGLSSPTVVGAQAANELLNVKNVKASFVLTPYNDQIYISARSLEKVNVQLLMEEFGGGGHMNLAGAQIKGASLSEVVNMLKKVIDNKIEEGDI